MYPSTTFIIEDQSQINSLPINETINTPLFMQAFSSDKGPEEMGVYSGEDFANIYGQPNFSRHGQPLLQAQMLINNGAKVLAKRVVASDATLANTIVVAKVKQQQKMSTDTEPRPLYVTPEGVETTVAEGNSPILKTIIAYELKTVAGNTNNISALKTAALAFSDYAGKGLSVEKSYPLFVIADNGRGVSSKKFRISANVTGSRTKQYLTYKFTVIENSTEVESALFTLNPDIASTTANLSLGSISKTYLKQVRAFALDNVMLDFLAAIKESTGIEDIDNCDVLFGKSKAGFALAEFEIVDDVNLAIPTGLSLQSGTNGNFGTAPINATSYATELVKFFNGTFTSDIYDVDNILLDGIIDANYPTTVKAAIESLVNFREDCFYFRDLGTTLFNSDDIISATELVTPSRYVGIYGNSYDVIDKYSKKQITVTMGYGLAQKLPKHFSDKRTSPIAGILHDFTFPEIIEGTVNFLPKIIPGKNEKTELFANHVNFISYIDGTAVLESQYTSQADYTGFSFINNTLAVQELIKQIRTKCPKIRYSFMEQNDLSIYQKDVESIINKYRSNFSTLTFAYAADKTYEQDMTFYAVLNVVFKKFVQAEVFRIIAINDGDTISI